MYFVDLFWDFKYLNAVSPVQKTQYGRGVESGGAGGAIAPP